MMKIANIDYILLFSVLILVILGAAAVYSASSYKADENTRARLLERAQKAESAGKTDLAATLREDARTIDGTKYYIVRQVQKILIGLFVMLIATFVNYKKWLMWSPFFLGISLVMLILLFTDLSFVVSHGQARRWLCILGITFQPSDFARYALILLLVKKLTDYRDVLNDWKIYLCFWLLIALVVGLVAAEPDLGTGIMITVISIMIFYLADVNFNYILATLTTMMTIALFFLRIHAYMLQRIWHFMAQMVHQTEPTYQIKQSLISFASGGVLGVGVGNSFQKFDFLPEAFKDMIFSIIGEELGLLGTLGTMVLFLIIFYRGMMIARYAPNDYGRLLATGITVCISFYAFTNAAVALGMIPTTGIPMPFISYGGSALVTHLGAVGILLNISAQGSKSFANYPNRGLYNKRINTLPFQGTSKMRRRK